jgi:DNA-binding GntR family transcriptional regulator
VAHISVIGHGVGIATLEEWAKLDLNVSNSQVLRATRLLHDDNHRPVALEEVLLPLERFPGFIPSGDAGIPDVSELAQRHGVSLGRASERVAIVRAPNDVASRLGIAAGADVLKLNRIVETAGGEPVEWRVTFKKI